MESKELIAWRESNGLSQGQLAKLLEVTRPCISQWESGERKIPAFLHLALKCLKVKKGGDREKKGMKMKKERKVMKSGTKR